MCRGARAFRLPVRSAALQQVGGRFVPRIRARVAQRRLAAEVAHRRRSARVVNQKFAQSQGPRAGRGMEGGHAVGGLRVGVGAVNLHEELGNGQAFFGASTVVAGATVNLVTELSGEGVGRQYGGDVRNEGRIID